MSYLCQLKQLTSDRHHIVWMSAIVAFVQLKYVTDWVPLADVLYTLCKKWDKTDYKTEGDESLRDLTDEELQTKCKVPVEGFDRKHILRHHYFQTGQYQLWHDYCDDPQADFEQLWAERSKHVTEREREAFGLDAIDVEIVDNEIRAIHKTLGFGHANRTQDYEVINTRELVPSRTQCLETLGLFRYCEMDKDVELMYVAN